MAKQNVVARISSTVKNYFFPTPDRSIVGYGNDWRSIKNVEKNLSGYITPVQLQRVRHDVQMWREAVQEAEQAWYPHRVRMQRMFLDTKLNAHVHACMNRRKNLTLLKNFMLCNIDSVEDKEQTKTFQKKWFFDFVDYVLDAKFFGYTLVNLGDVVDGEFKDLSIIRRHNISPDRLNVTSYVYSLSGAQFTEEPYVDWHIWIATNSAIGISKCGYGMLYEVALYEILCRNVLGFNADAAELYGMPMRVAKTNKTNAGERDELFNSLLQMGSSGAILMDLMDEIELVETKGNGQGFKIYADLEKRCENKISKIILGHSDAIDSTAGKLGATQGEESPTAQALEDIQTVDCRFVEHVINSELLPRMRKIGFNISEDLHFEFKNDAEREEQRTREDASNLVTAQIAQTMKLAGLQMSAEYFEERTAIETTEAPEPIASASFNEKVQNRIKEIYNKKTQSWAKSQQSKD